MGDEPTTATIEPSTAPAPPREATRRQSFMKGLFEGHIEQALILPAPQPSVEEQETIEMILGSIREFAERSIDSPAFDQAKRLPPEVIDGLKELGLFGMIVPEEHGGFGLSNTAYARMIEEWASIDPATATTIGAHQSIGLKGVLIGGTEAQKAHWLPKLASGELLAAFALTEPGAGSDAAGIQTTAKLSEDGSHFVLNGTKQYITNGGLADFFTVFARVEREGAEAAPGFTGFIVTRDLDGVSTGKEEDKLGIRASSTTQLILEDVKVPADYLLGKEGKAFKLAMEILNTGRLGLGAGCVGAAKKVIGEALGYAREREAFGKTIDQFELVQKKIARMNARLFGMESIVYLTTGLADRGEVDFSIESAICKVYCSEALWSTVNDGMQIAGGAGYMCEYRYEQILRDARINLIFEGTNEILRLFIALSGLRSRGEYLKEVGRALNSPLSHLGILSEYLFGKVKRTFVREHFEDLRAELRPAAELIEKYAARLAVRTDEAISRHKKDVLKAQFTLERLADTAVWLYVLSASVARMERLYEKKAVADVVFEQTMLDLLAGMAREELGAIDSSFWSNADATYRKAAEVSIAAGEYAARPW